MDMIERNYEQAEEKYATIDADTDVVLERIQDIKVSMHCWQGDDVRGPLTPDSELTGGVIVTGNFPGAVRAPEELRRDLEKAYSLIPGKHKLNLHVIYLDTGESVDLDGIEPEYLEKWVEWAEKGEIGLDFNPTFFSHPVTKDGFVLTHPDKEIREYWIEHGERSRKIVEYFGKETGQTSINNSWIPDGMEDNPIDRFTPRERLMEPLGETFTEELDERYIQGAVENKLFSLDAKTYTVGSHGFYMGYGLTRDKSVYLDAGRFHPAEVVSNKLPPLALFSKGITLHVPRLACWDSGYVVSMDDELQEIVKELVYNGLLERTNIGLDFFDATINCIAVWVIDTRDTQKALLKVMLEPVERLKEMELTLDFTSRMAYTEELKDFLYADVWNYFCYENQVPVSLGWLEGAQEYQRDVLGLRK